LPVEALVVLSDSVHPVAEPRSKRSDDSRTDLGVVLDRSPFDVGRLSGLIEGLGVNVEFSDVVKKSCPPQRGPVTLRQPDLVGDQVVEGTHSFRVASSTRIVTRQRGEKDKHSGERLRSGASGI
jgi:hypothetical protein